MNYKCLKQKVFNLGTFSLVPLRCEDKFEIMKWRNQQMDILRQNVPLTIEKQELYFATIVNNLFSQDRPLQLLFSFLENDILIGYGGLVHIDWESKNAEVSFITATERNLAKEQFLIDWKIYLDLLKKVADTHLNFVKIYTYAYDIRPNLFIALNESGFIEEARLKKHIAINNKLCDVLIHSFFLEPISFRMAERDDAMLYFNWANDQDVRRNSYDRKTIKYEEHCNWFYSKLSSNKCYFYLFFNVNNIPIGQVRIDKDENETTIGVSVERLFRGKAFATKMLIMATRDYLSKHPKEIIFAYIKHDNIASYNSFISAGFIEQEIIIKGGFMSYKLLKNDQN